jgi:hypothetical protein
VDSGPEDWENDTVEKKKKETAGLGKKNW